MLMRLSAFLAGSLALTGPIAWAEVAKRIPDRKDPTALGGGISFKIDNWTHIFRDPVLGNDTNNQMGDVYGYKNTYMPANIILAILVPTTGIILSASLLQVMRYKFDLRCM